MAQEVTVSLQGLRKAQESVKQFRSHLRSSSVGAGVRRAANQVQSEIKSRTPRGPTGNLQASIKVAKDPSFATRITPSELVDYVYLDHKVAPHSHLIEFGTAQRKQKKGGRETGAIDPPQPFFRPGAMAAREEVKRILSGALKKAIR